MRSFFLFVLVLLLANSFVPAQELSVSVYTMQDGMTANGATCIYQGSDDKLWIGSGDGLNIFDGTSFTKISVEDGLYSNAINCIMESKIHPGTFWVGTRKGLNKIVQGYASYPLISKVVPDSNVTALYEYADGVLLLGTSRQLCLVENGTVRIFSKLIQFNYIASLTENPVNKSVLINSESGLYHLSLQTKNISKIAFANPSIKVDINGVHVEQDGSMLVVSNAGDLYRITDKAVLLGKLANGAAFSIIRTEGSTYYAGTISGLLKFRISANRIEPLIRYTSKNGLPDNEIRMGLLDKENNLWYSTFVGLVKLPVNAFYRFPVAQSTGRCFVDSLRHFWVTERNQLSEFWQNERREWKRAIHPITSTLPNWLVLNASLDRSGRLWLVIGNEANKGELHCYAIARKSGASTELGKLLYKLSPENGFPNPTWFSFLIDSENILWCSADDDGIAGIDINGQPKLRHRIRVSDGLCDIGARVLYEDAEKNIWVGGWERGLSVFSKHNKKLSIKSFTTKDGLADNGVRSITQDKTGRMIIGTRYGGISVFENNSFSNYSYRNGLPSNAIWALSVSEDNRIIAGTGSGLAIANSAPRLTFHWLKDFRGHAMQELGTGPSGILWFLDRFGLTILPGRLSTDTLSGKRLSINAFLVNGKSRPVEDNMHLAFDENNLQISFSTVTYLNYELHYAYQLNNNGKWIAVGTQNKLLFSALASGTYELKIQGTDEQGRPLTQTEMIRFTIAPPFWLSWWFLLMVLLIVSGSSYKLYQWSVAKLKKRQLYLMHLIHEKEIAEVELQNSQALFTIINEGVSDLIAILDLQGKRLYSSKSYTKIFGDVPLAGSDSFYEIHEEDRARIQEIFFETIATGKGKRTEFRFVLLDGSIRYIESEGNLIRDGQGNPMNVIVVSRDITERKKYEEALLSLNQSLEERVMQRTQDLLKANELLQDEIAERELVEKSLKNSEEHYRLLVENANEAILVAQKGSIVYANPKTFELVDYSPEELVGHPFTAFIHPDDQSMVAENYVQRMSGADVMNDYHFRVVNKDGAVRAVEIHAVKIQWQELPATLNFLTDITERKRAEEEIRNALERERELGEIRSQFVSMASHEFRTPLTSILTSTEILQHFDLQISSDMRKNNLTRIQDNVKHMIRILNDVLFLGKWDAGKVVLKTETVNLEQLCMEVLEQIQLQIMNSKSSHIICYAFEEPIPEIALDYSLTRQILENLLSNAVKYSPGKKRIWFRVAFGKKLIFSIKDEGIGINKDDINNLFEPFHRGKNVGNISGTGLGLVVVQRAVALHKGTIKVNSKTDVGTEIIIEIPWQEGR